SRQRATYGLTLSPFPSGVMLKSSNTMAPSPAGDHGPGLAGLMPEALRGFGFRRSSCRTSVYEPSEAGQLSDLLGISTLPATEATGYEILPPISAGLVCGVRGYCPGGLLCDRDSFGLNKNGPHTLCNPGGGVREAGGHYLRPEDDRHPGGPPC